VKTEFLYQKFINNVAMILDMIDHKQIM